MNKIISKTLSAALAATMLASGAAALPASAEGVFDTDLSLEYYFGDVTDKQPVFSDTYKASAKYVRISWDKVSGASGYRVYRKVAGKGKYKLVAEISGAKNTSYKDKDVKPATQYAYKLKAYKGKTDRKYSKTSKALQTVTAPEAVKEITKVWGRGSVAKLKWTKQPKCDGYIVYYYAGYDGYSGYDKKMWKKAAVIESPDTLSARIDLNKLEVYGNVTQFYVKSFAADKKGLAKTSAASPTDTYINMNLTKQYYQDSFETLSMVKKGESRMTYTFENAQPKKSIVKTESMTAKDKKAIEKFAKRHFDSSWTDEEKIYYTLTWINRNVTYDTEYKHIRPGYADSIFNGRYGQCAQYNGALIETMAYLGYDATLIQGFRGSDTKNKWQHFWGEVESDGKKYVMEAGNYGQDGIWSYFCASYKYASNYIKNKKVVKK